MGTNCYEVLAIATEASISAAELEEAIRLLSFLSFYCGGYAAVADNINNDSTKNYSTVRIQILAGSVVPPGRLIPTK